MALNDREKFIMHMVTIMTLATMGDPIDIKLLQKEIRKGRVRKLTDEEVDILWEDMKEEILNGRAVYEEMIASLGMDNDVFKRFSGE
jgi:transposase